MNANNTSYFFMRQQKGNVRMDVWNGWTIDQYRYKV